MLFLLGLSSCSKRGCTDVDAENFEPKAKVDCGCCYYWAKGQGYYDKDFYDNLKASGAVYLKYYIDGVFNGQNAEIPYISSPPAEPPFTRYERGETYNIIMVVDLGPLKRKKMEVKITDQKDNLIWKDSVVFVAARVAMIQLN